MNFPNANLTDEEREARCVEACARFKRRAAERQRNAELKMMRLRQRQEIEETSWLHTT